jgi:hypothetical protein
LATAAAQRELDTLELPGGARWGFAGQGEDQRESFQQLGAGLAMSLVLMYLVLTVLYESVLQPFLILTALPLATVGAFLGLYYFGDNLSIPAFIGLIALVGLVGKNAILLVDRANELRRQGLDRTTALEQTGPSRLRPILMTSVVLVLSMLPVAMQTGEGGEVRAPIGAILVGGMSTSTFLSLLYVPVAYTYFDSFGAGMSKLFSWRPFRRRRQAVAAAAAPVHANGHALPALERAQALSVRGLGRRRCPRAIANGNGHGAHTAAGEVAPPTHAETPTRTDESETPTRQIILPT